MRKAGIARLQLGNVLLERGKALVQKSEQPANKGKKSEIVVQARIRTEWSDVETQLRPALLWIGARQARLLVALPAGLDPTAVVSAVRAGLHAPYLKEPHGKAIAQALANIVATRQATGR